MLLALQSPPANDRAWSTLTALFESTPETIVCHVVMRPTAIAGNELDGNPANEEELRTNQALRSALVDHAGAGAREIPIRILHGDPGERICEYAEYAGCDLIVLFRGEKSAGLRLRGHVAKYVAGAARASVLVVGA
jgi:nucleotide-binding universal stress UspA family protein